MNVIGNVFFVCGNVTWMSKWGNQRFKLVLMYRKYTIIFLCSEWKIKLFWLYERGSDNFCNVWDHT